MWRCLRRESNWQLAGGDSNSCRRVGKKSRRERERRQTALIPSGLSTPIPQPTVLLTKQTEEKLLPSQDIRVFHRTPWSWSDFTGLKWADKRSSKKRERWKLKTSNQLNWSVRVKKCSSMVDRKRMLISHFKEEGCIKTHQINFYTPLFGSAKVIGAPLQNFLGLGKGWWWVGECWAKTDSMQINRLRRSKDKSAAKDKRCWWAENNRKCEMWGSQQTAVGIQGHTLFFWVECG